MTFFWDTLYILMGGFSRDYSPLRFDNSVLVLLLWFLPSMVPRARVAVGIMLPLVFTSSNLAMRVASLLAGRFCFLCRSTRTFSPTCLQY